MWHELAQEHRETIKPLASREGEIKSPPISVPELEKLCEGDPLLENLLETMLSSCLEYTITFANFKRIFAENQGKNTKDSATENADIDALRRTVHDTAIADINIFSRNLAKRGRDISWMDSIDPGNRPAYTRFAVTLTMSRL
ncbi:MAG: hypothetical protein WCO09_00805 [bacterium]